LDVRATDAGLLATVLYPAYTIEQTSSWLVQLTYSQLVEPAWSCKRDIKRVPARITVMRSFRSG